MTSKQERALTVGELIEKLEKLPKDAKVITHYDHTWAPILGAEQQADGTVLVFYDG